MTEPPLKDVRILAIEQYGAGPFGTLFLASMGAEVIKVEHPTSGGDVSRGIGPHFIDDSKESDASFFFQGLNHNKKSIALDLGSKDGQQVFHDLAETADAVYTNLRGDVPEKLRLTYDHLKKYNKRLVCAHLSGYGRNNSRATRPGYDYIMQAESGYFQLTGEPDGPPTRFGLSVVDLMAGVTLSLGLASCIFQAVRTGCGRDVDVSLFDVALYNLNYVAMWYMNAGFKQPRVPRSAHFALVPCQVYKTADGWIYVMCNKEKFWKNLCVSLEAEELLSDRRFIDFQSRLNHRDELTELLDPIFLSRPTDEWMERFGSSVPASPVLDLESALENPFLKENQNITHCNQPGNRKISYLRNPVRYGDEVAVAPAPKLGEHTNEVLKEIGYSDDALNGLRDARIIL